MAVFSKRCIQVTSYDQLPTIEDNIFDGSEFFL